MSRFRLRLITAYCGHDTTEDYLDNQPLGCCSNCAKRMDEAETLKQFEEIRQQITATCDQCKGEIHPLKQSTLAVAVFWNKLSIERAAELALDAHIRHAHSDYDQRRYDLQEEGYDSNDARSIVRKEGWW